MPNGDYKQYHPIVDRVKAINIDSGQSDQVGFQGIVWTNYIAS